MSPPASADPATAEVQAIADRLGHRFADPVLLIEALTHRSWCAEHGGVSNERLEFLGDAVLGLAVATRLYRLHPELPEGELAKIRAGVVSADALAEVARRIDLGRALRLGRGEAASGGDGKESILSDAMEAVIGAVFLDGGQGRAFAVVDGLLDSAIDRAAEDPGVHDHKTRLQELVARHFDAPPRYLLTSEGPDHDRRFHAEVEIDGTSYGPASGTSKKRAEQAAAHLAWTDLEGLDQSAGIKPNRQEAAVMAEAGSDR